MGPSIEQRTRELYAAALTKPPEERSSYVARAAGPNGELRERVQALLAGQHDTVLPGYEPGTGQAEPLLSAGTRVGSHRIEGPLGAGGMGIVYFTTDTKLNRPAAIKLLPENLADTEARRRFQRESQMVSSLNHPHIVTVYDAGEYQGREYLITEYVDGGTLRQWAQRPRGWRAVVELLVGVADGIAVAHEAGILHRDIKPENILLTKNGYAKLADFGIAKLLESDSPAEDPGPLRAGDHSTRFGTLAYMSPEQLRGLPLDARSDEYSFGLVLHELLAGRRLETVDPGALRTLPPLPAEVPTPLRMLVAKALQPEPANRYQSMRDLVVDLRSIVRHPGVETAAQPSAAPPPPRRTRARTIGYITAAIAGLLVVGFLQRDFVRDALNGAPNLRSVAVLPFLNEGDGADDTSISERLADKLRDRLQELPEIEVIGRTSSMSFGNERVDMRMIARTLGVGRLINGSLRRRESTLEVRIEILDDRGFVVDTLPYESPDTELLELQQKISDDVAELLRPTSTSPTPTAAARRMLRSESANRLILFGSVLEHDVKDDISIDSGKLQKAIDYYRRATQADPTSIEAYSRLAAMLLYGGDVESARVALRRALEIGESLAPGSKSTELSEAYYTAALYLIATRTEGADVQYQKALERNANNIDAIGSYAQWLMTHNRSPEAEEYFKTAIRLDPLSLSRYVDYAEYLGIRDDMEPLRQLAAEIEQRFAEPRGYLTLARVYELTGDLDVGIAYGLRAYRLLTEGGPPSTASAASHEQLLQDAHGQIAELYARIGDFDQASKFEPDLGIGQLLLRGRYRDLEEVAAEHAIDHPEDQEAQYYLAFAYNATGDFKIAKYLLEQLGFPRGEFVTISGPESQASSYYIDALQSLGGNEAAALELARGRVENFAAGVRTGLPRSWWINMMLACSESQLGRIPEATAAIERMSGARGLPSLPFLRDSPCFKRLADQPAYIALIEQLEARQRQLLERLPTTLRERGVADVRP